MIDVGKDIRSVSDFKRNTSAFVDQMRSTGHPLVLTINGKAELVVQEAMAYQRLRDRVDELESLLGIRRGLADVEARRVTPLENFERAFRSKHGLSVAVPDSVIQRRRMRTRLLTEESAGDTSGREMVRRTHPCLYSVVHTPTPAGSRGDKSQRGRFAVSCSESGGAFAKTGLGAGRTLNSSSTRSSNRRFRRVRG